MNIIRFADNLKVGDWLMLANIVMLSGVAIFQDTLRAWVAHPRFLVSAKMEQPWAHKTFWNHYGEVWDEERGIVLKTTTKVPCFYCGSLLRTAAT